MILIPMLGNSSRFFNSGYSVPKYELVLGEKPVFEHVLDSFAAYFDTESFTFGVRSDFEASEFVHRVATAAGIRSFEILEFHSTTDGQATSVAQMLARSRFNGPEEDLVVFNADSFIDEFTKPVITAELLLDLDECQADLESYSDLLRQVGVAVSFGG